MGGSEWIYQGNSIINSPLGRLVFLYLLLYFIQKKKKKIGTIDYSFFLKPYIGFCLHKLSNSTPPPLMCDSFLLSKVLQSSRPGLSRPFLSPVRPVLHNAFHCLSTPPFTLQILFLRTGESATPKSPFTTTSTTVAPSFTPSSLRSSNVS